MLPGDDDDLCAEDEANEYTGQYVDEPPRMAYHSRLLSV